MVVDRAKVVLYCTNIQSNNLIDSFDLIFVIEVLTLSPIKYLNQYLRFLIFTIESPMNSNNILEVFNSLKQSDAYMRR